MTRWRHLLLWTLLAPVAGCGGLITEYGETDGYRGRKSLNGMASMRTAIEETPLAQPDSDFVSEVETREIFRLSPRTYPQDAIVWVPHDWPTYNLSQIAAWIDDWLAMGNRTLVFVVPDSGSTGNYWDEVVDQAPPEQRLEIRRRRAWEMHERQLKQANQREVAVHPFFQATPLEVPVPLDGRRVVEYVLKPIDPDAQPPAANTGITIGPGGFPFQPDETLLLDEGAFSEPVTFSPLVTAKGPDEAELTLLAKVEHPRWPGSQILVIAGGGLVTNFAMTAPPARQLVGRVGEVVVETARRRHDEEASGDEAARIAFLSHEDRWVPVSDTVPNTTRPSGMEFLTTWPISLVLIHAMFLGVVLCLLLLPIFGRPRRLAGPSTSNFGSHLSAVAVLMQRAGGQAEARRRISDYLKVVRGESSGPWVLAEPPPQPPPQLSPPTQPPPKVTDRRPDSSGAQPGTTNAESTEPELDSRQPDPAKPDGAPS